MKRVILIFGVVWLLLIAYGCNGNKASKVSNDFECSSVSYSDSEEMPEKVYAYIDASGSMKGYFSLESDGRFITAISNVNPDRINWMDGNFTELKGVPTNELLTSSFSGGQSRFDKMLPAIIERDNLTKSNAISLLFTDGILSASAKETNVNPEYMKQSFGIFKNYIANALKKAPGIAIAVFKLNSKYDGSYWNYQNKNVQVNIKDRPFYVIAMGRPVYIRNFLSKNNLGSSLKVAFGIYDTPISNGKGTLFAPTSPKDFDGNRLISNNISFALTLPNNVVQLGDDYIKRNVIIEFDGKDESEKLRPLISVTGSGLTISGWDTNNPAYPIVVPGEHELKIGIPHRIDSRWEELYSEDDLNIDKVLAQQKKTFGLKYLLGGIQNGLEKDSIIFSSSIQFTK